MKRKHLALSILQGLLLIGLAVAGHGSGCNSDSTGGVTTDDGGTDGSAGQDLSNPGCGLVTCASARANCGKVGDGCGGVIDCGTCTAPETCGGGGISFQCGGTGCIPTPMQQACMNNMNATCGEVSDGCNGTVTCGTCTAPQTCGGGGVLFQCGTGMCTPTTCAAVGANCGTIGDGCGKTLNCGTCTAPQTCGGGMVAGQCGTPICMPRTCAQANANCGMVGDGCGNLIPGGCGTCPMGQLCGGAGVPNNCGAANPDAGTTCTNLCLKQVKCDGGSTTITGTVTAPGHDNTMAWGFPDPIPGALVYVPNGTVMPFTQGVTCDQCGSDVTGSPLVQYTTGIDGKFTITNAPCGTNIPLVIQLGRWRRQIVIPAVACCANTALTTTQTRLPRTKAEGDIPAIAIVTGSADPMECVLPKIGLDPTEFTNPGGTGRVQFYQASSAGAGATLNAMTPKDTALFGNLTAMKNYDLIILDCEGNAYDKSAYYNNLVNYTNAGGRIYMSHYGYSFIHGQNQNPPPALNMAWNGTATWNVNQATPPNQNAFIDQTFPKGMTFANWLRLVTNNMYPLGQVPVQNLRFDFTAVTGPPTSQRWMYYTNPATYPLHYTFNTPVGAMPTSQCGRVMYSDFHVNTGGTSSSTATFPAECNLGTGSPLSAQEKVLEFMLFDLTSCIKPDVPMCTPSTCMQLGYNCGMQGDGCGGAINCGTCPAGQTCGGGGVPGVCGGGCTPKNCMQLGYNCGQQGDGCGNVIDCGMCPAGQTCGGGGPGKCGGGMCVPKTCAQFGYNCGKTGDGCTMVIDCGTCPAGQTCGGGGTPNQCGGSCVPRTCMQANANCGIIGNGCGGTVDCGPCPTGQGCGVLGTPNQCGVIG